MNFIHTENHYPIAKDVIWEEVFDKIDEQYQIPDLHVIGFDARPHTIIIKPSSENGEVSFPPSLTAVKEAIDRKVYDMQFYFSLGRNASVYPSHRDKVDVFLVQSKGTVTYVLEEGEPNETKCKECKHQVYSLTKFLSIIPSNLLVKWVVWIRVC